MLRRFAYYTMLKTNLPKIIFLGITSLSVISSLMVIGKYDGLESYLKRPLIDFDDQRAKLDGVVTNGSHVARYQLKQTAKKEAKRGTPSERPWVARERPGVARKITGVTIERPGVARESPGFASEEQEKNGFPDKQRDDFPLPSNDLSSQRKAKRNENNSDKSHLFESSAFISSRAPFYIDDRLLSIHSSQIDSDLSSKRVIRSPRRRRPKTEGLELEDYYWDNEDEIQERRNQEKRRDNQEKSLSSPSSFFSMGSPEGRDRNKKIRKSDSETEALLAGESLASLLEDSNFRKKYEFRDLEDKFKSYEPKVPKGKEQSRIVKLNREKFLTEKIVSNPQIREYSSQKKFRDDEPLYKLSHDRRWQTLKGSKSLDLDFETTTLPPFLKELDIPLNFLNPASHGEKVDLSRFLSVLDSLPRGKINIDESIDRTREGILQSRNRDKHESPSSLYRNSQHQFFGSIPKGKISGDERFGKSLGRIRPSLNRDRGNSHSSRHRHRERQHFDSISKGNIGSDDQFDQFLRSIRPSRKRNKEEPRSSRRGNRKRQRSDSPSKWKVGSDERLYKSPPNIHTFRNHARKNTDHHSPRYEYIEDQFSDSIFNSKMNSEERYDKSFKGILPSFHHDSEYRSPKYQNGQRQFFGRKDPIDHGVDWQDSKVDAYDSSEFSSESYNNNFHYDNMYETNSRFRDSKKYDSTGSRRGKGRIKPSGRYRDDSSEEDLPSLDSSVLLASYEEQDVRKKGRDSGRKKYNRYNDDFFKEDSRGPSSFEHGYFRNYGHLFDNKQLNFDKDKSHFYNHDENKKEFRSKGGKSSDFSLSDGFFNSKPNRDRGNEARHKLKYDKNRQNEDRIFIDIINSFKLNNKIKDKNNKKNLFQIQIGGDKQRNITKHFNHKNPTNHKEPLKNVPYVSSYSTVPPIFKEVKNRGIHTNPTFSPKPTKIPETHSTLSNTINLSTKRGDESLSIHKLGQSNTPLSPGGSPVIINSTFFITTAAPFHYPPAADLVPRLRTPSFVPRNIPKRNPVSNGNRIIFVNASKKKIGGFQGAEKPLGTFPVSNRGLSGVSHPVNQKSNLEIHHITNPIGTQPFSSVLPTQIPHPTPYPTISSSTIPGTVTHLSNRPSFPFSVTPQLTTPRPSSPFPGFLHPITPIPGISHTTQHSITSRQAVPFSVTPNPKPHFFTTIAPIGFSSSPYPTSPLPGTLRPNSPSSTTSYFTTPLRQPRPTLSVGIHPTTRPPRNIVSVSIPNISHSRKILGPTTLPLVATKSPVHTVEQNQDGPQTPWNHVNNRKRKMVKARQKSTSSSSTISGSNIQDTLELQTPNPITLPPSSTKGVRRLRKKKRRFKVRRKSSAALSQGENPSPRIIPLNRDNIRSRRRENQINTTRNSKSHILSGQNINPSPENGFRDTKILTLSPKTEGLIQIEQSQKLVDDSFVKIVNHNSRIKKPTKPSKLFFPTLHPQLPFFTTASDKLGEFPLITTPLPRIAKIKSSSNPIHRLRNRLPVTKNGIRRLLLEKPGFTKNINSPFDLEQGFPINNIDTLAKTVQIKPQYLQIEDRRKVIQDVPVQKLTQRIIPHRTAYGSILLDPRRQHLPQSLVSPLTPRGQPILHSRVGGSLNGQFGRAISSTLHHYQPLASPYLQGVTPSLYYGSGSYPVSGHRVPFNGISPIQGGAHTLRNYSVRKTFSSSSDGRSGSTLN